MTPTRRREFLLVPLLLLTTLAAAEAPATRQAGFTRLTVPNPMGGGAIQTVVWCPTTAPASPVKLGPFDLEVAIDGAPEAGAHPLIAISHGTGGSNLGHHDTAIYLARHGFVVITPMHPGDNFQDTSAYGTDAQLFGRPRHIKAVLDAVVAHPVFGRVVDTARIGVAGMSAGGYTALVLVGGKPDFAKLAVYCREQPDDPWICGRGPKNGGPPAVSDWAVVRDLRIKSAVLMAPALGPAFDQAGLADVRVPIRLYRPEADEVLRHPYNAERVRMMLPRAPEYVVLPGAGHYVFLAPYSPLLAQQAPQICVDPPGVDRGAVHARLNAEIEDFFRRTLQ